jgi:hypothetical protein
VKNSTSVKAFWLSFLISGVAVPLGAISATAQIQDTSTPEVALEGNALPVANPASALAAVKIEIPQLAAITAETNSAVSRARTRNRYSNSLTRFTRNRYSNSRSNFTRNRYSNSRSNFTRNRYSISRSNFTRNRYSNSRSNFTRNRYSNSRSCSNSPRNNGGNWRIAPRGVRNCQLSSVSKRC